MKGIYFEPEDFDALVFTNTRYRKKPATFIDERSYDMDLTERRQKDTAELMKGLANGRFVLTSYSHSSYTGEPDRIRAEFAVYPRSVEKNWLALDIKKVIFNDPATIVFWEDGTKTVVKCGENDIFDPEKGIAMAIAKKALGNNGSYYNQIKKWLPESGSCGCSDTVADIVSTAIDRLGDTAGKSERRLLGND